MTEDNLAAVIAAARESLPPQMVAQTDGVGHFFLPRGSDGNGEVISISRESGANAPLRKRGTMTVFDAASFNMILADNKDAGNIAVYIDRNPGRPAVVAVLNGHGPSGPGWGDMRAKIEFRSTPQWAKWTAIDGKLLSQADFAEFVEDNLEDIAEPSGAAMLEIATYLEATRTTQFKSGLRLSSGAVQLQNLEDVDAKVSAGRVEVPETFTLALSPIQGCPTYRVPARFRWRIVDGKLKLGIKLQRVEDSMRGVLDDVVAKIERGANISVLEGVAPEPTK